MSSSVFFRPDQDQISPKRKRGMDYAYLLLGAVFLVLPMLYVTAKRSELTDTGYSISELRDQNAQLREDQAKLRERLNRLTRPNRIFEKALAMNLRPVSAERRIEVRITQLPTPESPPAMVASLAEE